MKKYKAIIYEQVSDGKGGIGLRPVTSVSSAVSAQIAGEMIGVSKDTIYRLVDAGHLEAERPSPGRVLIPLANILEYKARIRDPEIFERQMKRG